MKKIFLLFAAVVMSLGFVVSSDAIIKKGGMKKGPAGRPACGERMMEKLSLLGLDDRQKEEMKAIHLRMKKDAIKKRADIDVARVELREIMGKDTVDLQAAEAKVRQLESLKAEMKIMHIRTHEEVKSKLTPEQRKKFNEMMAPGCMECEDCGMGGPGRWMKGGPGKGKGKCDKCFMRDADGDDMPSPDHRHMHNR